MVEDQCSEVMIVATNRATTTSILDQFQLSGKAATLLSFITLKIPVFASG